MKNNNLTSENFSSGRKSYFIDFNRAVNNSHYICITRSDLVDDGSYRRSNVVVFEEDFHFLISAMSSLFHSAAHLGRDGERIGRQREIKTSAAQGGIRSWDTELRPREKFIAHGTVRMSDAELMAMLIGTGRQNLDAVALSENILRSVGGRLDVLARHSHKTLLGFDGIGPAKSSAILAALELGRRMCAV